MEARICWDDGCGEWKNAKALFEIWSREENLEWAGSWPEVLQSKETSWKNVVLNRNRDNDEYLFVATVEGIPNFKRFGNSLQEVCELAVNDCECEKVHISKHGFKVGDKVRVKCDIAGKIKKDEVVKIIEIIELTVVTSYMVTKNGLKKPAIVADHEIEKL